MKKLFLLLCLFACVSSNTKAYKFVDELPLVPPRVLGDFENASRTQQSLNLRQLANSNLRQLAQLYVNNPDAQNTIEEVLSNRQPAPLFWTYVLAERVENSDFSDIAQLVRMGANVNAPVLMFDRTPLHYAARAGDMQAITDLLANGADINAQDKSGNTPLHQAIRSRNTEAVKLLINAGANACLPDKRGETAQDLMKKRGMVMPQTTATSTKGSCVIS